MIYADTSDNLITELVDGILTITFNRPEVRNAFAAGMAASIAEILSTAKGDRSVRCVIFRGAGSHFSAGGDVAAFNQTLELSPDDRAADFRNRLVQTSAMVNALMSFNRPVITALRGAVAGAGLLFPLASDLVISDDTATLVFAHRRIGLVPDGGVSYLLPRVVGWRAAKRLLLTAAMVTAADAEKLGIIDLVSEPDTMEDVVARAATQFSKASQRAVIGSKEILSNSLSNSLDEQLNAEKNGIIGCVLDDDFAEGVRAFTEKRSPVFPSTL